MKWLGELLEVVEVSWKVRTARRAGVEEWEGTGKCRTRGRRGGIVRRRLFGTGGE